MNAVDLLHTCLAKPMHTSTFPLDFPQLTFQRGEGAMPPGLAPLKTAYGAIP